MTSKRQYLKKIERGGGIIYWVQRSSVVSALCKLYGNPGFESCPAPHRPPSAQQDELVTPTQEFNTQLRKIPSMQAKSNPRMNVVVM